MTTAAFPDPELPEKDKSESVASSHAPDGSTFSTPKKPKISAPAIDQKIAEADEAGQRAAAASAEEIAARSDALRLSTKIEALTKRRDELTVRLRNLESTDIQRHRAQCEASVKRLMGIDPLTQNQNIELNSSLTTLPALDAKAKLLPHIVKELKSELAAVTAELGEITKGDGNITYLPIVKS